MIRLRIDVDYAFPSKFKSCLLMKGLTWDEDIQYLCYSKALAQIINSAECDVKAYWFFTKYTLPDKELLSLINSDRHIIGLHIANNPQKELALLEKAVGNKVEYYTIHGTERLLGQLVWNRKIGQRQAAVPKDFRLKSFHNELTYCLDWLCYKFPFNEALVAVKDWVSQNAVLEVHPDWLIKAGNHRGPYADMLKHILSSSFRCA